MNYITSFDFVCLTETYIASDFDSDLFRDFGILLPKQKQTSMPRKAVRGRVGTCKETVFTVRGGNVRGCGQCGSITNEEGFIWNR